MQIIGNEDDWGKAAIWSLLLKRPEGSSSRARSFCFRGCCISCNHLQVQVVGKGEHLMLAIAIVPRYLREQSKTPYGCLKPQIVWTLHIQHRLSDSTGGSRSHLKTFEAWNHLFLPSGTLPDTRTDLASWVSVPVIPILLRGCLSSPHQTLAVIPGLF